MARSKGFDPVHWFTVEQLVPTSNSSMFRFWAHCKTREDAEEMLRKIPLGRILEVQIVEVKYK